MLPVNLRLGILLFFTAILNKTAVGSNLDSLRFEQLLSGTHWYSEFKNLNNSAIFPFSESNLNWQKIPNEGFIKPYDNKAYLLKFSVNILKTDRYYFENDYTMLEDYRLFVVKNNKLIYSFNNIGFKNAEVSSIYRVPVFSMDLDSGAYNFYVYEHKRFSTSAQNFSLYNSYSYLEKSNFRSLIAGGLLGVFIMLILTGIVSWLTLEKHIYGLYTFHLICLTGIYLISEGFFRLLNPDLQLNIYFTLYYFIFGSMVSMVFIFNKLISVFSTFRNLKNGFHFLVISGFLLLIINHYAFAFISNWPLIIYKVSNLLILVFPLSLFVLSLYFWLLKRDKRALWFLVLFSITILFLIVFALLPLINTEFSMMLEFKWLILLVAISLLLIINRDFYINRNLAKKLEFQLAIEKHMSEAKYFEGAANERMKLSGKMHDEISILIVLLKQKVSRYLHSLPDPLKNIDQDLDSIYKRIRNFSHSLNPVHLRRFGIRKAIEEEILQVEDAFPDMSVSVEFNFGAERFKASVEEAIYFSFLELMNNALKHSGASELESSIGLCHDSISLVFRDNGIGIQDKHEFHKGIGLEQMRTRAESMGGTFSMRNLEKGIEIFLKIPI